LLGPSWIRTARNGKKKHSTINRTFAIGASFAGGWCFPVLVNGTGEQHRVGWKAWISPDVVLPAWVGL